mmetsp:Transcript_1567/g.4998  ORF Transcript_1567/g.4998 Transcript_1567/m.4998 type:complete len:279 (-) Transcript_1567:241-1077(-)
MGLDLKKRYGSWALVTGGHSGIGYHLAEQIAAEGIDVVLSARKQGALDTAAAAMRTKHGVEVKTVAADCSTEEGVQALIDAVKDLEINVLVPNAGVEMDGHFVEADPADLQKMLFLNMSAPTLLARHYGKLMVERGKGAILLISSILGFAPAPYVSAYAATKAYVGTLGESLHAELKPLGVDVSVLSPGFTHTPMAEHLLSRNPGFPVDSPQNTAAVGLWALGRRAHRVPLLMNRFSVFLAKRVMPRGLLLIGYKATCAMIFQITGPPAFAAVAKGRA